MVGPRKHTIATRLPRLATQIEFGWGLPAGRQIGIAVNPGRKRFGLRPDPAMILITDPEQVGILGDEPVRGS